MDDKANIIDIMTKLKEATILVVEDDEAILDLYTSSLKKKFSNVITARDGLQAFEKFQEETQN